MARSPDKTLNAILDTVVNICRINNGEMLGWQDSDGTFRRACMIAPSNASTQTPLPMMVWLHPTLIAEDTILATDLPKLTDTADLTGDPTRPGFILLLPIGRNIEQFLPAPLNVGIGWDHWYRNLDRTTTTLNQDVAAIDHFIATVKARGIVDPQRVYVSGWSEGADMGTLYGLNTEGIAMTGVYSTISPFDDPADPCPGPAFATNNTRPYELIVRQCDTYGACQGGQAFLGQLEDGVLASTLIKGVILNTKEQVVQTCDPACAVSTKEGSYEHLHWPKDYNDQLLTDLRNNPLP